MPTRENQRPCPSARLTPMSFATRWNIWLRLVAHFLHQEGRNLMILILLWLLGVPLGLIIILWLLGLGR
jgi:hypothetical protein